MSPPLLGVAEEGGQNNVTLLSPSAAVDSAHQQKLELKEHNYMGLSDCSSVNGTIMSNASDETKSSWNLKATELRLGLPGSQSPVRDSDLSLLGSSKLDEKPLFPLHPSNDGQNSSTLKQGNKRGFSDVMDGFSESKFLGKSDANVMLSPRPSANLGLRTCSGVENLGAQPPKLKEIANQKIAQESSRNANEMRQNHDGLANNSGSAPASKAQVVGWPPIRSFRKNSLATSSKNTNEADGKAGPELFVKVSMDGAPYLRKVDLATYSAYQELSSALEKMFSCTIVGQFGSHGTGVAELLSDKKLNNLLRGSEYVLTYEDKDGDWMLVGDVPWEMFIDMCKKLRIMKHCDAIGLAPRAGEKTRSRN